MIKRLLETSVKKYLRNFPAVAILGPRQSGKTTLAKMLVQRLSKECIWIDLELPEDIAKLSNPVIFFEENENKCVIIDEVQRLPDLFPVMRAMIDRKRVPGRFIVLGSASPSLLRQSSESLAGRIIYAELSPFYFPEIERTHSQNKHWLRGGFPPSLLAKSDVISNQWLKSFFLTYLERDLPSLGISYAAGNMKRLFSIMAHQQGSIFNASSYSNSLGISSPTVSAYAALLENTFLTRTLQPFFSNAKKRIVKSPKRYVRDSGMLHSILGISSFNSLLGHPVLGKSWEGYVIEQIIAFTENAFDYYFYRTQDGTECDLVIARNNKPVACVECKISAPGQATKGFMNSIADLRTAHNFIVVVKCNAAYSVSKNVTVCDLKTALKKIMAIPELA